MSKQAAKLLDSPMAPLPTSMVGGLFWSPHFLTTEQDHRSPGGSVMSLRPPRNHLGKNLPTASPSPISATVYRGLDLTTPG